jgi:hypothetical protein
MLQPLKRASKVISEPANRVGLQLEGSQSGEARGKSCPPRMRRRCSLPFVPAASCFSRTAVLLCGAPLRETVSSLN